MLISLTWLYQHRIHESGNGQHFEYGSAVLWWIQIISNKFVGWNNRFSGAHQEPNNQNNLEQNNLELVRSTVDIKTYRTAWSRHWVSGGKAAWDAQLIDTPHLSLRWATPARSPAFRLQFEFNAAQFSVTWHLPTKDRWQVTWPQKIQLNLINLKINL